MRTLIFGVAVLLGLSLLVVGIGMGSIMVMLLGLGAVWAIIVPFALMDEYKIAKRLSGVGQHRGSGSGSYNVVDDAVYNGITNFNSAAGQLWNQNINRANDDLERAMDRNRKAVRGE